MKELVDIAARNIPMIHAGLATTRDYIKSNPDKVRRYAQAYIEANKIARTDAETTKQVIGKWTKTENKEDLDETYNTYVKAWEQAPYVSSAAMQAVLNFAINPNAKAPSRSSSSTTLLSLIWTSPASSRNSTNSRKPRFST
jgi:ABC-type nitrate/sulfonate/bicarbonate transport system substrate-binding protein